MSNLDPGAQQLETHDCGNPSHAPASSQVPSSSVRAVTALRPSPTKAIPAVRTFFDPWNSSSTGHQRAENRLSGSTSWRASRNLKLSEQYKGGLGGGGKRVADSVGAGSANFGKDGRKENGGWEKGAPGLRTGGQKSLVEIWGASKSGKKSMLGNDSGGRCFPAGGDVASQHTLEALKHSEGTSSPDNTGIIRVRQALVLALLGVSTPKAFPATTIIEDCSEDV
jgi:hypothetical protein